MAAGPLAQLQQAHSHSHSPSYHGGVVPGTPGSQPLGAQSGIAQSGSLHQQQLLHLRPIVAGPDTVRRLLADLARSTTAQEALALRKYVEEEARDLGGEAFTRFMDNLYDSIQSLLASEDMHDNMGAVRAIHELVDVRLGDNATKIARFASYLKDVFETKRDFETLAAASIALGHMALEGGALTADMVEIQVTQALQWLQGERVESKRFAAVLILKEMAENAPTVFNIHVPEFIDAVWVALRDISLAIRERAVEALRACLCVIEKRETRWRVQWYYRMFEATQEGLKNASVESIHGSLLAVGELLRNTGEFMMSRYKEVAAIVFKYRDHRDKLVRRSITALLPRIADFLRDRFVSSYLQMCMEHLLAVMRNPAERASGFAALGEMAVSIGPELKSYLPVICSLLREAIAPRRGKPCPYAIACVGCLAEAMKSDMEDHVRSLLDQMFAAGLTPTLVGSLNKIALSMDSLLPKIQEKLLETISYVLAKTPYRATKGVPVRSGSSASLHAVPDTPGPALTQLALRTLTEFNLKGHELLQFARESVVGYLEDKDPVTRREAAICCCRLVEHSVSTARASAASSRLWTTQNVRGTIVGVRRRRYLIEEILEKLLVAGVADEEADVRRAIFESLAVSGSFEDFLAQADSLRAIFIALNDEALEIRELAISMAGRLAEKNPAYVLPALRKHLLQLLRDLEQSAESKSREESAKQLGGLIKACERLIVPYITPVLKTLISKLGSGSAGSGNSGVVTEVLATIGDLARVAGGIDGGLAIEKGFPKLMPLIVDALLDSGSNSKREVAVATLGDIVESTGYVVAPYTDHPQLLGVLLRMLNGELAWSTRREVLKVLGIIGALDPHIHKRNLRRLQGVQGEGPRGTAAEAGPVVRSVEELPMELWQSSSFPTTSDEYYPTVAINALIRILREPSLSSYHLTVVRSLMYIFKAMGLASVPYLPKVLPDLFQTIRVCEEGLREYIFVQLAKLVFIVKQHIRKYLDDIRALIADYWSTMILPVSSRPNAGSPILNLIEQLCLALHDEFRVYLPELLPRCVQILTDAERSGDYTCVLQVLHTFEVFGGALDDHMHLLLPVLVRLFTPDLSDAPLEIRRASLRTLSRLLPSMQVSGHISNLFHPLARILDGAVDELRSDAVDALCSLAVAAGSDFFIFVSSVRKLIQRHHLQHSQFDEVEHLLRRREPVVLELPLSPVVPSLMQTGEVRNVPGNSFHGLDSEAERNDLDAFDASGSFRSLKVNDVHLRTVWETSKRSTKEDWLEWMRHFSVELLKESPSPALRTCAGLAQVQPYMAKELFAAGFVSCWVQLDEFNQDQLIRSFNNAFMSPNIPPEILAAILNLAEFMEHDEKDLPIDIRTLGGLAEKCHAYAKALHYKEMEFAGLQTLAKDGQRSLVVEALIHINNQLNQHEAAVGILTYAQQKLALELKESWYEKLQRWEDALRAYEMKLHQVDNPHDVLECTLGQMRCLAALAQWENLSELCRKAWAEPSAQKQIAPLAASAAWNMGRWDEMSEYVRLLGNGDDGNFRQPVQTMSQAASTGSGASDGAFFRAVLHVRHGEYEEARSFIEKARKCLATEVAAVVLESYDRAYSNMVRIQQLAELEEVIDYSTLKDGNEARKKVLRKMWAKRIQGTKRKVEVWQALLSVRTLVLPPDEDLATWIKFSSLCRKSGRKEQARQTLVKLMKYDPEISPPDGFICVRAPEVMLAYFKYQWSLGEESKRREAFHGLEALCLGLDDPETRASNPALKYQYGNTHDGRASLLARMYVKLGAWQWVLSPGLDENTMQSILAKFNHATDHSITWAKAWHKWAYFNTEVMNRYNRRGSSVAARRHLVAAVSGYFQSIANASSSKGGDDSLQDILRLLTLWFTHGASAEVQDALQAGLQRVNIDTWLVVLPQIIARIHSNIPAVRELIQSLLVKIGRRHPQALMYPLLVACKSISPARRDAAVVVMDKVRQNNGILVDQAQLVSRELIRVAILWHEMWHEALEEASRLYFGEHNVDGMLNVLKPLHEMLNNKDGPPTAKEESFLQDYGQELQEANECCNKYRRTGKEAELTQAWDLYYHVFKRINKQLPSLTTLELQHVSPALVNARNLQLAVPGTYRTEELVTIREFAPQLIVITSKQRPRKLTIHGSDGVEYTFLLKGHEDLRQDERVMQLFGLVNTLLSNARSTAEKDLSIQRYAVIPLSPNSGLIGWVPNCDTLHHLIREYRDTRKVLVNLEHKLMLQFAPDYEHLTLIAKIEVFEHALESTVGDDLAKVLWLKSRSSEVWLDRRTNYTRSLAVMSMVGYLLGLGDRHPSNLMLDRFSGKILHIDFGDCFEASMNREKFPEKVPFRLTRMLVKAMEVSGIEGNFRLTCDKVMQVLRNERDSVMAMMEAFVHDPLINWRLFNLNEVTHGAAPSSIRPPTGGDDGLDNLPSPPGRVMRERELREAVGQLGDANEVLNERAVQVMARMKHKLTGRDFVIPSVGAGVVSPGAGAQPFMEFRDTEAGLKVDDQVQKLIAQATSHENLCQSYVGWCPFW